MNNEELEREILGLLRDGPMTASDLRRSLRDKGFHGDEVDWTIIGLLGKDNPPLVETKDWKFALASHAEPVASIDEMFDIEQQHSPLVGSKGKHYSGGSSHVTSFGYGEADAAASRLIGIYKSGRHLFRLDDLQDDMERTGLLILMSNGYLRQYSMGSAHGYVEFTEKFIVKAMATDEAIRLAELRKKTRNLPMDHNSIQARLASHDPDRRCPVHGIPMHYSPASDIYACQDPTCQYAHGID